MAWKLRKDKLKAESPEGDAQADAPSDEAAQTPVFDLSGDAFRTTPAPDAESEPTFTDEAPAFEPSFDDGEKTDREPIDLGAEPIDLEPIALEPPVAEHGVTDPTFEPDPLPEFDPIVAPSEHAIEPEAIHIAPVDAPQTVEPVYAPQAAEQPQFEVSPERENIAPGLVTTESENGLPKVAPFIIDAPAAPETPRMSSVVIRIGKLSATHFLTKDVTTIGRPDSVLQNYPDIEIELDDGISRRHAEIRRQDEGYLLVDVGSTNGTILNGEILPPHQPVPLYTGDRIRIGERTELQFE